MLPVDDGDEINWELMDEYMQGVECTQIMSYLEYAKSQLTRNDSWKETRSWFGLGRVIYTRVKPNLYIRPLKRKIANEKRAGEKKNADESCRDV